MVFDIRADEAASTTAPRFLGSQSCSSSSCHGGADEKHNQYTIWFTRDFHHARPYATLETARSERLADVLKIGNPTQNARCTVCHAPFQTVPAERFGPNVKVTEGISCESCHGPAESWIRSHTRPDYTHTDRVASGMRDLKNLYVRANTCVACHQNLDPEIRAAGHPELIFEMDGQCVTMPRHWSSNDDLPGPQAWLVGQAAALREISWQLATEKSLNRSEIDRFKGLRWLVRRAGEAEANLPTLPDTTFRPETEKAQNWSDELAKAAANISWTEGLTRKMLAALSDSSNGINDPVGGEVQARQAERLVLALDRLTHGLSDAATNAAVNESLNKLFAEAQSLPDFNPQQFAKDLNTFHSSVAGFLETK